MAYFGKLLTDYPMLPGMTIVRTPAPVVMDPCFGNRLRERLDYTYSEGVSLPSIVRKLILTTAAMYVVAGLIWCMGRWRDG